MAKPAYGLHKMHAMRLRSPFFVSLLLSLGLHSALLTLSAPLPKTSAKPPPIEVELPLPDTDLNKAPSPTEPLPDQLSSEPPPPPELPPKQSVQPSTQAQPAPQSPAKPVPRTPRAVVQQAQAQLMKQLLYPPEAIKQGLEGEVVLLLSLDAEGAITNIVVARSSGHALLDSAAMSAARGLGKLRADNRQLLLPVEFALE